MKSTKEMTTMNKMILLMTVVAATMLFGCSRSELPVINYDKEPMVEVACMTCSDALKGNMINRDNSCDGSFEVWQDYKIAICAEVSQCKIYCEASLCSGQSPSPDCRACGRFGTILHPVSDYSYMTCRLDE